MRESFEERITQGKRIATLTGLFIKYGEDKRRQKTALLKYVKDENGEQIVDHLWVTVPMFWPVGIDHMDWIQVRGMITTYLRSNYTMDYQLGFLERVVIHRKNVIALREEDDAKRARDAALRTEAERKALITKLLQGRVEANRKRS